MKFIRTIAFAACILAPTVAHAEENSPKPPAFVQVIPTSGSNAFYQGNRIPLLASPLIKLPIGAIRPEGWLRKQLQLEADGMIGHLTEISQWCNFAESAWTNKAGDGKFNWEEMPYWLKGFGDLGYVLGDERITAEAAKWIKAIMATQRDDGTFGPRQNFKDNDLWPHFCVLYALRSYYEATGDKQALTVMTRYFQYVKTIPAAKLFTWDKQYGAGWWQWIRAADQLDNIHWLYNITGDKWLLDLAKVNHERTADWTGSVASWHGVNIAEAWRGPAQFYPQSKDPLHLQASIRNYDEVRSKYGQVPGGMYGSDENCREGYNGPRQGTETCSFVEMMYSHEALLKITGDVLWADRCEEVALNSFPASYTPDFKGIHYLTCPNQIQCDRANKSPMIQNGGDMMSYTPYENYRCCQHNVAMGWPYYAEHLWFATPGNGLAAAMYAASEVKAKVGDGTEVTIREQTNYPFNPEIRFRVAIAKATQFPLALRIPNWCGDDWSIAINDEKASEFKNQKGMWAIVDRTWNNEDRLVLTLPMPICAKVWDKNRNAVSIERGPLTYSLAIQEEWKAYDNGKPWKAFEVFPKSPWNYGLVIDPSNPADTIKEIAKDLKVNTDDPFTPKTAPVTLVAKAKRIPQWEQEANGLVGEIRGSPVASDQPEETITLIPMGCTRLRISMFPRIGTGPDAKVWRKEPPKPAVMASWCWSSDTALAVVDDIVPRSSNDTQIARFTWFDHKGTDEWVEITLPEPKKISSVAVYWFDDTGMGHCRAPAKWEVQTRSPSHKWEPVKATSVYGVEKDKFNKATFEPVTADKIRIAVKLQKEFSGGILEARVGE